MEKLQPLIKHRYWICFGLSVMFVVVGWWMASGAIATETDNRRKAVKESFEKAKQGATDPNQDWVAAAKELNAQDDVEYKSASNILWVRQQNARKWPDMLQNDMKGIGYQKTIANKTTRGKWAAHYRTQMEKLLEIVKPFKPESGEGLVMVDPSRITHKPYESWKYGLPASAEIWNNQEDIWLLQSLLTSIAREIGRAHV